MPPELPAKSPVTIQQIDADTWIVRRQREASMAVIVVPIIKELPADPEWEKVESAFAAHAIKGLAPFEE